MSAPIRVVPATLTAHLDFNTGEDARVEVDVVDDVGDPVQIADVYGCIRIPGSITPLYVWSPGAGNVTFTPGQVVLVVARADTTLWWESWGDAEWQLEVTDAAGHRTRVCEGDVRVRPTRRP